MKKFTASKMNIETVFVKVTQSAVPLMVYRGTKGVLIAIAASKTRAKLIYRDSQHKVVGFYDKNFNTRCGKVNALADFVNDVETAERNLP